MGTGASAPKFAGVLFYMYNTQADASHTKNTRFPPTIPTRHRRLGRRRIQPHNLHLIARLDLPHLHAPRHDRPAPRDGENILHRHEEGLVEVTRGLFFGVMCKGRLWAWAEKGGDASPHHTDEGDEGDRGGL